MQSFFELAPEFQLSWYHWTLAFLSAMVVGMSKGGIKGISILMVVLLAIVFGSKASTGILLPLLSIADIIAVWYYNRHTQWKFIFQLMPWMMAGVILAVWIGKDLPEELFKQGMAGIILISVAVMYWWDRKAVVHIPTNKLFGWSMGLLVGFTTMIGNLAGPFANIFFLAMRLPKNEFIGTAAWLFFIINLFKFPFHIFVWGTITPESLAFNFRLIPGILIGLFLGIILVKIIKEHHYRHLILILTAIGAVMILYR